MLEQFYRVSDELFKRYFGDAAEDVDEDPEYLFIVLEEGKRRYSAGIIKSLPGPIESLEDDKIKGLPLNDLLLEYLDLYCQR